MKKETLLNHLKAFDPAVFGLLQDEVQRQRNMLSLVPTVNAMSPLRGTEMQPRSSRARVPQSFLTASTPLSGSGTLPLLRA